MMMWLDAPLLAAGMKRITIVLTDELHSLLQHERRQRDVSAAAIVREALEASFRLSHQPDRLAIIGLGRSGHTDISENVDAILAREWGRARDC